MSIFDGADAKTKEKLNIILNRKDNQNHHKKHFDNNFIRIPDFVAVDIETTGLNKNKDRVIEIGAVKFIGGKMTDTFSTLVNPNMSIPPRIAQLTGITDETVKDSPQFCEIMGKFIEFIGRLAICGHNVDFDISFLNAEIKRNGGQEITNWNLDSLVLSRIILQLEEGYALSKVARHLDISLENAHRALDDAKASGLIAVKLIPRIRNISDIPRARIANNAYGLMKRVFDKPQFANGVLPKAKYEIIPDIKPLAAFEDNTKTCDSLIDLMFNEKLKTIIGNYKIRGEQIEFAHIVANSLDENKISAIEAGTGTGKTVGYLIPAIITALQKNKRIVISTNTKQLQNQLANKDLPVLAGLFDKKFSFAVLKGKNNYICRRAFEEVMEGESRGISPKEKNSLLPLINWYYKTKTGDIEEQNAFNRKTSRQLWDIISAENKYCPNCSFSQSCFLMKARKYATAAHIVVVNHAFFYSDIIAGNEIIENTAGIIFDEAHHLEEAGYYSLQTEIDTNRIGIAVEVFQDVHTYLHNLTKTLTEENQEFISDILKLKHIIHNTRKDGTEFLKELTDWLSENDPKNSQNSIITLGYKDVPFAKLDGLRGLLMNIEEFYDTSRFIGQKYCDLIGKENVESALVSAQKTARQFKADLEYVCGAQTEGDIFWIEGPADKKWVKLTGTTTNICGFLSPFWKQYSKPVIFTSATLSPQKNIEYFAQRVGISDYSPVLKEFETKTSANEVFFAASAASPEAGTQEHNAYTAKTILEISRRYQKNILVLFTNNENLENVFVEMNRGEKHSNIFAQGISGNNAWIQRQMKGERGAVLLGSGSFWEGIDMSGEECEIVIIPKLPFPVPTHPLQKQLVQNAEKDGQNGFIAYSLPETLLKFRQGMGRLIRRDEDRGAFIILDNRIVTKNYGKHFIDLVGSALNKYDDLSEIFPALDNFFEDGK